MKPAAPAPTLRTAQAWLAGWWFVVHGAAVMGVLALSPTSWRSAHRSGASAHLVAASGPVLLGFCLLIALISLVLSRIVIVTALSYGLSQYALEMVVRVLVLELIPLTAALYAALRATLPMADEVAAQRASGRFDALSAQGRDPLAEEVLPRVLAGLFAVMLLAAVSGALTLVLAYVSAHGFTLGGFERYTRTVGRVFSPTVTLIFGLKVAALSAAVAWIPMATVLQASPRRSRASIELQGLMRLSLVLLLIEAASLMGNYY